MQLSLPAVVRGLRCDEISEMDFAGPGVGGHPRGDAPPRSQTQPLRQKSFDRNSKLGYWCGTSSLSAGEAEENPAADYALAILIVPMLSVPG